MTQELFKVLYDDASSSTTRDLLAETYPERYKEMTDPGYKAFDFTKRFELSTSFIEKDSPLVIANGYAPIGLEFKCLIVHEDYKMEVFEHRNKTLLKFIKK
jgi:hypothetical protein